MANANPWLDTPISSDPDEVVDAAPSAGLRRSRPPLAPQPGVLAPGVSERLPRRQTTEQVTVWWLGTHGGAGESTLAELAPGSQAANHAWPIPAVKTTSNPVVLVARTNYAGLLSAQHAATEWAAGTLGDTVELRGLVLIADAPGRLPKPLRALAQVISGGVPHIWQLPWSENWRLGPTSNDTQLPREYRELLTDLDLTLDTQNHRKDQA